MSECKCDMRTKLVGDGCSVCNPELALHYAQENIEELEEDDAPRHIMDGCGRLFAAIRNMARKHKEEG